MASVVCRDIFSKAGNNSLACLRRSRKVSSMWYGKIYKMASPMGPDVIVPEAASWTMHSQSGMQCVPCIHRQRVAGWCSSVLF